MTIWGTQCGVDPLVRDERVLDGKITQAAPFDNAKRYLGASAQGQ